MDMIDLIGYASIVTGVILLLALIGLVIKLLIPIWGIVKAALKIVWFILKKLYHGVVWIIRKIKNRNKPHGEMTLDELIELSKQKTPYNAYDDYEFRDYEIVED